MARDFTKNTSNLMNIGADVVGPLINGAASVSFHCFGTFDSFDTGTNDNAVYHSALGSSLSNILVMISGGSVLRIGGRSEAGDSFQSADSTTTITTGSLWSLGAVLNFAGDKIRIYVNGTQEADTTVTFGGSTYTHTTASAGTDRIGARVTTPLTLTSDQTDGRISEVAIWSTDIGSAAFASLADGYAAPLVAPPKLLVVYFPLLGNSSPEPDLRNSKSGTITGTIAKADHPRILYGRRRDRLAETPAAASGSPRQALHLFRMRSR